MNFRDQSQVFLETLAARKRNPVKQSTLVCYRSRLENHILPAIRSVDLAAFGNGAMKELAQGLSDKGLKPKTILETITLVQQVIASAVNSDGDRLYPRDWNYEFLDLPPIIGQKQPTLTSEQLKAALADPAYGPFYALLAGTGLRIGEAAALRYGADGKKTGWDPSLGLVDVRSSIWRDQEWAPKTPAAVRQIDVHPALCSALKTYVSSKGVKIGDFLFSSNESRIRRNSLAPLGIEGFHAFRRFRTTHLREQGVPEDLIRYWIGHTGVGMTDRYSKMAQNVELRKIWVSKAGLGFEL